MNENDDTDIEMLFWSEIVQPNEENVEKYTLLSQVCTTCFNFFTTNKDKIDSIYLYQKKFGRHGINWERYGLQNYVLDRWNFNFKWKYKRQKYLEQKYSEIKIRKKKE